MSEIKPYNVEVIRSGADFESIADEFNEFIEHVAYDYEVHYLCSLRIAKLWADRHKNMSIFFILVRKGNRVEAVAPFIIAKSRFQFSFSFKTVNTLPVRFLISYNTDFLIRAANFTKEIHQIIWQTLNRHRKEFDIVRFNNLTQKSLIRKFCGNYTTFKLNDITEGRQLICYHRLWSKYDDWFKSLSKSTRKNYFKKIKKLEKKGFTLKLNKIEDVEDVSHFLEVCNDVYGQSWKSKVYGSRKYTIEEDLYYRGVANEGSLRCYILCFNNIPVAFQAGIQSGNIYHLIHTGYDKKYYNFSPGIIMFHLIFQDLYENSPPRIVDFGFGSEDYKRTLSTEEQRTSEAFATCSNFWLFMVKIQLALNLIYTIISKSLSFLKVDEKIREILKKKR